MSEVNILPDPADSLLSSGPLTQPKPKPVAPKLRSFDDAAATRASIYDHTLQAAQNMPPLEDDKHRLHLTDVSWADPERFTRKARKKAVLTGDTLARRLQGTWVLQDAKTGQELERRKQIVGRVPYLSSMGTFTHNGSEYTVNHQQRLLSGIFARVQDNGDLESHVNVLPGEGVSHRYFMDPAKSLFKIRLGQAEMPLMPLLHHLGATDQEIRDAWGDDIHAANYKHMDSGGTIKKLAARLLRKKDLEGEQVDIHKKLTESIERMKLDPEVMQRNLGVPYDHLDKNVILAATKKLLAVNKGEAEPDDRDHLANQRIYGPEDLFSERISRDHGNLRKQLFRKISAAGTLAKMPSGALTPQIEQVLLGSGLAQALEEINPLEVLDKQSRITRLGEGGIPNTDSVPDEARAVQPSHMGYIDPLRTPECYDRETEVMTESGWKPWSDIVETDRFACLIDGVLEWHAAKKLYAKKYVGEMIGVRSATLEYLVTPNHRLWVRPKEGNGQYRVQTAEEAFMLPRVYATGHLPFIGNDVTVYRIPAVEHISNNMTVMTSKNIVDWAELLGWYLGEGLTVWREHTPTDYRVAISQSRSANPANCLRIERLLDRLELRWSYNVSMKCYVMCGKQITGYFRQFGYSQDRYIPEEWFSASVAARSALLEALLLAEGRRDRKGRRYQFCSTSLLLAEGVQRLAFSLGQPTTMTFEPDDRQPQYLGCYVVHMQSRIEREAAKYMYYKTDYDGMVYCATVPGGLLYVRRGRTSGHWSGNSFRVGIDLQMANSSRKGDDGRVYTQFRDRRGNLVYKSPQEITNAAIATPDVLRWNTARVPVMKGGKLTYVPKNEIDYVLPHFEKIFSPLGNMVPLKSMVKGQRVAMASRMLTQALPLVGAEAPWVQTAVPGTNGQRSYEEEYGKHAGAIHAEQAGRVEHFDATEGVLHVRHDDGTRKAIELYRMHPFNRKTFLHQTPTVKPGSVFKPGQILARSNYTDANGATALGVNANVAYMPWKGYNYEDAQVISESMAKKLSSEHAYQHELEVTDNHKMGKNSYISLFPGKFDRKTLDTLDEKGIIRLGSVVEHGQPLILAAKERDNAQNKVHKKGQSGHNDESVLWNHHDNGVVTDVVWGKQGPVVLVKTVSPMRVGDKMCYDPETNILTKARGWVPVADITVRDEVFTLNAETGCGEWQRPTHVWAYDHCGEMYALSTKHIDMLVTPEHRLWVARPGEAYQAVTAREFWESRGDWQFKKDCAWEGVPKTAFEFSEPIRKYQERTAKLQSLPMDLWLEFLGYYIAEGLVTEGCVKISKSRKSPSWKKIDKVFKKIGLPYRYAEKEQRFEISNVWFAEYMQQLGDSYTKRVPEYVQELPPEQIQIFFDTYMAGDGHKDAVWEYSSSSLSLVHDIQLLCLKLGWSVTVKEVTQNDNWSKERHWRGRVDRKHLRPWWKKSKLRQYASLREGMVPYDGKVYCITVPNHIIYVERRDKTYWSLNSGRYG